MKRDCVAEWASESGEVDILLVAGSKSFYKDFYKEMAQPGKSRMYNALQAESFEETEELIKNRIKIGTKHWESGERAPKVDEVSVSLVPTTTNTDVLLTLHPLTHTTPCQATGNVTEGLPHPSGSHLIISEDLKLLQKKLEDRIPTGYIIINGRKPVTDRFCSAIHDGKPVFIFKHTGDSADLICEALKEAREYAKVPLSAL